MPTEAVDGPIAGRRGDPRAGLAGQPVPRPPFERRDEGVLDGLLGDVEVAGLADERRDRPSRLLAEQAVDELRA